MNNLSLTLPVPGRKNRTVTVQENAIDRIIRYVAPDYANKRLKARAQGALIGALSGSYVGGRTDRRPTSQWSTSSGSADEDTLWDIPKLRSRSRDLIRNAPIATGAINTKVTNVICTGLKLQSRVNYEMLNMTEDEADAWQKDTEFKFRVWAESQECDIARTLNFYGIQQQAYRQRLENGDVFVIMPRKARPGSPFLLKLQIIEADRVCNENYTRDSETLAGGVERDENGAPKLYHIMKSHPGSYLAGTKREWIKVPAFSAQTGLRNVVHLYSQLRPQQSRGVPDLAPVIETLKQLDRYTEAEIMAAVISSMFTVFIETENGGSGDGLPPMAPTTETGGTSTDEDYKLASGAIIELAQGSKISTADPKRPNTAFDPFVLSILRQIGVALELPFEVLVKHFTASYSAARAALLQAWLYFKKERTLIANDLCQVIYEVWLAEQVARDIISAPGFFDNPFLRAAYCKAKWVGDSPGQINPKDEIDAAVERMNAGVSTLDEETQYITGGDVDENIPQIKKERRLLEETGLWQPVQKEQAQASQAITQEKKKQNLDSDLETE